MKVVPYNGFRLMADRDKKRVVTYTPETRWDGFKSWMVALLWGSILWAYVWVIFAVTK